MTHDILLNISNLYGDVDAIAIDKKAPVAFLTVTPCVKGIIYHEKAPEGIAQKIETGKSLPSKKHLKWNTGVFPNDYY